MRRARYRLGQFWRYLFPRPLSPAEQAEVGRVLPLPLLTLFRRLAPGEQRHSLAVMRRLVAQGEARPELLQAALLHDAGKSAAPLGLVGRSIVVLARRLLPGASGRWGQGEPRGLRRPFVTAAQHAEWGADLCEQAGASPLTVALVRWHQVKTPEPGALDAEGRRLLLALQAADDDH